MNVSYTKIFSYVQYLIKVNNGSAIDKRSYSIRIINCYI